MQAPRWPHVFLSFFFLFIWRCRFFRVFFVPLPFSLCMESASYVLSFRMVFFYFVTTGWIFDISLCDNCIFLLTLYCGSYPTVTGESDYITYTPYTYSLHTVVGGVSFCSNNRCFQQFGRFRYISPGLCGCLERFEGFDALIFSDKYRIHAGFDLKKNMDAPKPSKHPHHPGEEVDAGKLMECRTQNRCRFKQTGITKASELSTFCASLRDY